MCSFLLALEMPLRLLEKRLVGAGREKSSPPQPDKRVTLSSVKLTLESETIQERVDIRLLENGRRRLLLLMTAGFNINRHLWRHR